MPGHDGSTLMENDTEWVPNQGYNAFNVDRTAFFGRVAYAHGTETDQPLSITRIKYADQPFWGYSGTYQQWEPFAVMPHWNSRGQMDRGHFADGGPQRCISSSRCVRIAAPQGWFAYDRPKFTPDFWHGTLLEDKHDRAGTSYRRNRQYDPYTGRFTQEDPIGLAGGLNVYGFAGGDPVDRDGTEDADCRKLVTGLRALAAATAGRYRRNPFAAAADAYEKTNREVEFVSPTDRRLNVRGANTDRDQSTFTLGRTLSNFIIGPNRGQVLIRNDLGPSDVLLVATHEALVHFGEGLYMSDWANRDVAEFDRRIYRGLPTDMRGSAGYWRRKIDFGIID